MKRLRVPIDRHADGQLTEVLRKMVLVMPYRPCCSHVPTVIERCDFCCGARRIQPVLSGLLVGVERTEMLRRGNAGF
jgi:hypothetical protein